MLLKTPSFAVQNVPAPLHSIFHERWWLNAATDGRYDIIEVTKDGRVVADLPLFTKKRFGLSRITRPPYTRTLGPRLFLPPSKPFRRAQNIRNTIADLVQKLPAYDSLKLSLDPEDETPFAFSLCGFTIEQAFTFRIPVSVSPKDVWTNCDQKTRNLIRTADQKLTVEQDTNLSNYIRMSLVDQPAANNSHDFSRMEKIFEACKQREQGCVMNAWDEAGKQVASIVLVWDDKNCYFWQSARDRTMPIPGANMLLIWKSIEYANKKGLTFDFDSFASVRSAKMIASFGQSPIARPQVMHSSVLYKWERAANATLLKIKSSALQYCSKKKSI